MPAKDKDAVNTLDTRKGIGSTAGRVVGKSVSHQRRKVIKASAAAIPAIMTLRSGSVAAMASVYQCLNHPGVDTTNIDPVLGDGLNVDGYEVVEPSHDEMVRLEMKPILIIQGNKAYWAIRNEDGYSWNKPLGWTWFTEKNDGSLKTIDPSKNNNIEKGWDIRITCYCTLDDPMVCIAETGSILSLPLPEAFIQIIKDSIFTTKNMAYFDQNTGLLIPYPLEPGDALPLTGSCLCSINPDYQFY